MTSTGHIELLRHGRTAMEGAFRGRLDDPLRPEGHLQMVQSVAGLQWSRIVTSPLRRCRNFGEKLARKNEVDLTIDPRLAEYDFGEWEGQDIQSIMASDSESVHRFLADPRTFTPPGGEEYPAFRKRVLDAWQEWSGERPDEAGRTEQTMQKSGHTLIITHGGVILCILGSVLGQEKLHEAMDVPHGCISRISRSCGNWPQRLLYHGVGPIYSC